MCVCVRKYICKCVCIVYVMVGHTCHGVRVRPEDSLQVSVLSSTGESRDPVQVVGLALLPISLVVVGFSFCFSSTEVQAQALRSNNELHTHSKSHVLQKTRELLGLQTLGCICSLGFNCLTELRTPICTEQSCFPNKSDYF